MIPGSLGFRITTFACSLAACVTLAACSGEVGPSAGSRSTRTSGSTSVTSSGTDTTTSSSITGASTGSSSITSTSSGSSSITSTSSGASSSGTSGTTSATGGNAGAGGATSSSASSAGGAAGSGSGPSGAGAGGASGQGGAGGASPRDGGAVDELQFCLEEHNRYRALVGSPPLTRSAQVEQFAAEGAKYDYDAKSPHKHFGDFVRGTDIVAENEVPGWGGWSVEAQGSVHGVVVGGLRAMWDEGPGGGHYENMKDPKHKALGCGIHVAPNADQDVTLTVDFTN